jgi:hypothetical protein
VPWQSGHYYLFSKFLIEAVAPSASGLLALYACREQILICEADDVRETLLRLCDDITRLGFTRPAGFTFELCPANLRLQRLKQLLLEHERVAEIQPAGIVANG